MLLKGAYCVGEHFMALHSSRFGCNDQTQFWASFLRFHQTLAQSSFAFLCLIVTQRMKTCFFAFLQTDVADLSASLLFSVNFKNYIQYFKSR